MSGASVKYLGISVNGGTGHEAFPACACSPSQGGGCGCEAELGKAAGRAERCSRSRSPGALAVGMQALRESFPQRTGSLQRLPLFWDELN